MDVAAQIERVVLRHLAQQQACSWALVESYDAVAHRARCRLQPEGLPTGALPVLTHSLGTAPALRPGQQCIVLCIGGRPTAVAGVAHRARDPIPLGEMTVEGDVHIRGALAVYGALTAGSLASGTATIAAATTVSVTHGLLGTPANVVVTPRGDPGSRYWVESIGASTFVIRLQSSGTATFGWVALLDPLPHQSGGGD